MNLLDLHIVNRVRQQAETNPERCALRFKENSRWQDISWAKFQQKLDQLSLALLNQGIGIQDKVGIFAHNMPNWTIVDIATLQLRAITVPIYATNTPKQAEYILNNADVEILFVGDSYEKDILGAKKAGMLTAHLARKKVEGSVADLNFKNYFHFEEKLKKLMID